MDFSDFGRTIILFGVILIGVEVLLTLGGKIPGIGKLPGDIFIQRDGFTFYFPLTTAIIISLALTIILNLFLKR